MSNIKIEFWTKRHKEKLHLIFDNVRKTDLATVSVAEIEEIFDLDINSEAYISPESVWFRIDRKIEEE